MRCVVFNRVTELEGELKAIRAKEKKEAETLDRQLKQLESNYRAAVGRVKELEMQVDICDTPVNN